MLGINMIFSTIVCSFLTLSPRDKIHEVNENGLQYTSKLGVGEVYALTTDSYLICLSKMNI